MLRRVPANTFSSSRNPFGQPGNILEHDAGAVLRAQHRLGGEPDILLAIGALDGADLAEALGHRQPFAQIVIGDVAAEVSSLEHGSSAP